MRWLEDERHEAHIAPSVLQPPGLDQRAAAAAMALDGALDRALSESVMLADEARAAERAFTRRAAWCERNDHYALHARHKPASCDMPSRCCAYGVG